MDWQTRAIEICPTANVSIKQASLLYDEFFPSDNLYKVQNRVRSFLRRYYAGKPTNFQSNTPIVSVNEDITPKLTALLKNGNCINNIANALKVSERVAVAMIDDLIDKGHCIDEMDGIWRITKTVPYKENAVTRSWNGDKIIRFGVVSDAHMGSNWQQLTELNRFYNLLQSEGITTVYNPGDLTEGVNMRAGHEYEVFVHGCDAQAKYVIDNYPKRDGITTEFITGNHDHSGIKHSGHDIGPVIANARPDMAYLGRSQAKVKITPNCEILLNHPLDGASYALSYALQKTIDSMAGGKKPNILLNGHHHKAFYLFYRNIHALECGTFQAQTPWMAGKRIAAMMGGWIVEAHVDDEGTITRFKPEFMPVYNEIEHDY